MRHSSFNPSKEMTAVPPTADEAQVIFAVAFQPLKGNDSRAAHTHADPTPIPNSFQPLKGNDSRAAAMLTPVKSVTNTVSTPQRK